MSFNMESMLFTISIPEYCQVGSDQMKMKYLNLDDICFYVMTFMLKHFDEAAFRIAYTD